VIHWPATRPGTAVFPFHPVGTMRAGGRGV
jgi:hypothetical protein